jgi:phage gp29-like protein
MIQQILKAISGKEKPKGLALPPVKMILEQQRNRARQDIAKWKTALSKAEHPTEPRRQLLVDLYDDIMLDAHLSGQVQVRKLKTIGARFSIYNSANESVPELTWLLKAPWFGKLVSNLLDAKLYGHTLIQIDGVTPIKDGKGGISGVSLVPRRHIVPEFGQLLPKPSDSKGIDYRTNTQFEGWIIETPEFRDFGLLNQAVPLILYKRFAMGAWSEFCELFGMPVRVGKTNMRDREMVSRMEDMMRQMASAPYAIVDESETIEFVETAKSNGEVFHALIDLCNAEVSKLIVGAVQGERSKDGSRAKEEVSERTTDALVASDKEYIEQLMNYTVIPVLIQHGYPFEGCTFAFEDQQNLAELWKTTYEALQFYEVDEDFIKETFGIPVTGKRQQNNVSED